MKPILQLGSLEISTYALLLSLGACLGFWLTFREIERKRLDLGAMLKLTALAFVAGFFGARSLGWLATSQLYEGRPAWSVFAVWDRGGMSLYGGLAFAAVAGLGFARSKGLDVWEVADTLVVAFLPAIAVARLGCFMNGCCYGKPTAGPLGIVAGGAPNYVNFGIPSHPAQLYDAAAVLALFAVLWRMRDKRQFSGQLTVAFLAVYPLFRFFHEMLRADPRPAWDLGGGVVLSLNQVASVGLMLFAVVAGFVLERRARAGGDVGAPARSF